MEIKTYFLQAVSHLSLIGDLFTQLELQIDNVFASLWHRLRVTALLHRAGLHKRSGGWLLAGCLFVVTVDMVES
jgi:hypothetical protein